MPRRKFPFYKQLDTSDCGPSCLRMIAKHYGRAFSLQFLREKSFVTREGVSLLGISEAAEAIGMRSLSARTTFEKFQEEVPLPCIAHWKQNHFIVVHRITKNKVHVADPAHGLLTYTPEEFKKNWFGFNENGKSEGVLLLLEPTPEFHQPAEEGRLNRASFKIVFSYLFAHKKYLRQLFLSMLFGSIVGLIFPFLTQSLVDFGINNQNLGFIYTILIAQLMLFFSRTSVDFIQSWILLHLTTRINISIISDFLIKMMKLPMPFFEARMIGDLLQRIGDHRRIENFMTSTTLSTLFSLINLFVYSIVLLLYDLTVFSIFAVGSAVHSAWILIFLNKRREIDYKRFNELSANQSSLIQLINGMQEIKLNNCERQKRWEWEHIQAKLFKVSVKGLAVSQYQQAGSFFINELKNILITFLVAKAVVDGNMTLGMMMAVQYILGQLNAPIGQLIGFVQVAQDAKISLERLGEIHEREDEEKPDDTPITVFPKDRSLYVHGVDFQYEGPQSPFILKNLALEMHQNKVTALVGVSGSGKTTLLKLLLKFYQPVCGEIKIGDINLAHFSNRAWREKCGVVMQDGFLFADTIARNIALGDARIDPEKLLRAVTIANIREDIESLPLGYNTKIGMDGHGLSQGQKQRLLIARAVYKNPEYLFFDEATSSLDANTERAIMENLDAFFKGKTVVIVAHRLSTVKKADQLIVLDKGRIVEQGTHAELTRQRGAYFNLVKNQLELGN
jgi:ATP-binding cassette subfamily B protein